MTTTAPRPRPVERRAVLARLESEPAGERPEKSPAAAWIDAIFYASVSVFVASLMAYFLIA